ncbi:hypothetical protein [Methylobacterium sp. J-070]|uniref:hypothetical protein n=1 Tax=Methylobacterium sp. J-070 TaxID=2836650 RepID=UPI001FBAF0A4|nr:hypothetical protein [Methylobacterium sp. J-070]MCJ2049087.1 hypothetical protein [Methylobacterium sp. J-070]
MSPGKPADPKSLTFLRRIADALGMPLKSFFHDAPPGEDLQLVELLHLWKSMTDPQAKSRVLDLARREAALCGELKLD